ncbi:CCC motif membrane protein [Flagellimonas sp.]|uniref:CCC motif membrane protein n=1 Tax=Flagellimonas sp. TaxID=2058762 RepID=UPI003F4A7F53
MEQQKLPNATLILVFGILSIVGCCCVYGVVGLIFGIIALVLAKKATATYKENPELYSDYNNVKTGRILAIIGVILASLTLIMCIALYSMFGFEALQDPERLQELLEQYQ